MAIILAAVSLTLLIGGVVAGAAVPEGKTVGKGAASPAAARQAASALADFNRGAAHLEQLTGTSYGRAVEAFENVLKVFPDWQAARFNLGLACMNRQDPESLKRAKEAFEQVLKAEPNHLSARFSLGIYYQHIGQHDQQAMECFRHVYERDPKDAYAAYKLGETLLALGQQDEGLKKLEETVELDPGFVSAYYRLGQIYMRRQQRDKAQTALKRFQELKARELAWGTYIVQETYGSAGKYYLALGANNLPLRPTLRGEAPRVVFSPEVRKLDATLQAWKWQGGEVRVPGVAVGDLNGDGNLDLILTGTGKDGEARIFLGQPKGGFAPGATVGTRVVCPVLGDLDNDGDLDLWLGRAGGDVLMLNDGKGNFAKASVPAPAADAALTGCARMLDLDSDGDLDLLSMRVRRGAVPATAGEEAAPSVLWNNNRDGTFAELAEKTGLALADTAVASIVYDDLDNDRDLDLLVVAAGKRPMVWRNDRAGKFQWLSAERTGLDFDGACAATSGDPNKDGRRDLLLFGKELALYRNMGGMRFERDREFTVRWGSLGGTSGQFADMDNDGDLDLVIGDARRRDGTRGPVLLVNDWPNNRFLDAAELDRGNLLAAISTAGDASCVVADFNADGKCDVLLAVMGQAPVIVENATQGGNYLALDLVGEVSKEATPNERSPRSPIGARVEVKADTLFQQHVVGVPSGAVAMPPLRVHAGLGPSSEVQWLRILWPDAALQAELELAANRLVQITEDNRKSGSCPHLFAWDGERFVLVADFGGVGGLGYLAAPGRYAAPDPTEYLPIPRLAARGGEYVLQVLEPLEEVVYLDEAKLIAVDHPEGTEVFPNEIAAVGLPQPAFEVYCLREKIEPVKAVDHRGADVTDALRRVDRRYAGATDPDARFIGYAREHFVEMDFGSRLGRAASGARPVLVLNGWVEFSYSSTNFAASQAGLRLKAPSLHVLRGGQWVEIYREAGYPGGLQHTMTLDLTGKLLPTDRKLRLSSNMELYWDQAFVAMDEGAGKVKLHEAAARGADLHYFGYPREYSPDGRLPNLLDYGNVDRAVPWKLMQGDYTRYGEVTELVQKADDCFVIMGRGEELTLRFPADPFGPVPEGHRRSFLLKAHSYCKDMDLYTAYPDTVEPLPFAGMSGYPYGPDERYPDNEKTRAYRRLYNTRNVGGR